MKALIDTNILVYAHDSASHYQIAASELLQNAISGKFEAFVSTQNIAELYSIITSKKRLRKPLSPSGARRVCKLYLGVPQIKKIVPGERSLTRALEVSAELSLAGPDFFDCLLAATMEEHGLAEIYTENVSDFERIGFVNPSFPLRSS